MQAKNATPQQVRQAVEKVSRERYGGNVIFEREPEHYRGGVRFTLRTVTGKAAGSCRSHSGRRMAKACWHAHGHVFDELLRIAPEAVIDSGGVRITAEGGNWTDRNIGSMVAPLYFSEACNCEGLWE